MVAVAEATSTRQVKAALSVRPRTNDGRSELQKELESLGFSFGPTSPKFSYRRTHFNSILFKPLFNSHGSREMELLSSSYR